MWTQGVDNADVIRFVREGMGSFDSRMWGRAGAAIRGAYRRHGRPLHALTALDPPRPVLHLYAQPADPAFLAGQQEFARHHPWFSVRRLEAKSHFPMLEVPDVMADAIEAFAR